jgi:hypothetical protein
MSSLTRSRGRSMFHAVSHVAWRGDSFQIREASKFRRFDIGMTMVLQPRASTKTGKTQSFYRPKLPAIYANSFDTVLIKGSKFVV